MRSSPADRRLFITIRSCAAVLWSWKRESAGEDHRNGKICCVCCSRVCVRSGFVDDGADASTLCPNSISDGRDRHGPLGTARARAPLDRGVRLAPAETRGGFSTRVFSVAVARQVHTGSDRAETGGAQRLKPQRRSMHQCVHAISHEARKCQHQWRCTTKCKKDLRGNAEQGSLVGDAG